MGKHIKITKIKEEQDLHEYEIVDHKGTMFVRLLPSLKKMIFCNEQTFTKPFLYLCLDEPFHQETPLKDLFEPNSNVGTIDMSTLARVCFKCTHALRNNVFPKYMDHCCG